jgi:hypothetical protein
VDQGRPRFTMDRHHGRPQELTGARPPATPGLKVIGEGRGGGGGGGVEHICGLLGAREVGKRWRGGEEWLAAVGAR